MLGLPDLLARRKESLLEQSAAELTRLDSDSFKPEEVLQEVRGLLEQQRVTEFLQNEIERQHLEQVLMETIERRQNEQQRRSQRRQVRFAIIMNLLQLHLVLLSPEILFLLMTKDVSNITTCHVMTRPRSLVN